MRIINSSGIKLIHTDGTIELIARSEYGSDTFKRILDGADCPECPEVNPIINRHVLILNH